MNRIDRLFIEKQKNILSVYFTAGYPRLDDTVTVIEELSGQGAEMIEIGIPFSDPMADGPVIQQSGAVALSNGMTLRKLFGQLKDIRKRTDIPLVMMGYLNPILQYGIEAFCRDCAAEGIDGLIIPDLPFADYLETVKPVTEKYGLHCIMLVTPETSEERIRLIDAHTSGFIYLVSTASTTGAQASFNEKTTEYFSRIAAMKLKNPLLIGFGISNKATFSTACRYASGAIVGSAFVRLLGEKKSVGEGVGALMERLEK